MPQGIFVQKLMDVGYVPLVKPDAGPTEETVESASSVGSTTAVNEWRQAM